MISELEQIRDTACIDLKDIYSILADFRNTFGGSVDISNVVDAVTQLMTIVGKFKSVSGSNKKFIVTKLLIQLVKETSVDDESRIEEILDSILINVIPTIIDKLISVENGKLKFNKDRLKFLPCF